MQVNFIGAGKLGKYIAKQIVINKAARIEGICNLKSGAEAVTFIGQGKVFENINTLPPADITFITTPDDCIQDCCGKLAASDNLKNGSIVLHCSGSLSSDHLNSVKGKGCHVASVHPMRSFAESAHCVSQHNEMYCAIEGDKEAIILLAEFFKTLAYNTYTIDSRKKTIYHAAGVFASNYLVTLYDSALHCLRQAGIEYEIATKIITGLMKNTLHNIETTKSAEESLTGPIKRGDLNTISEHLRVLPDTKLVKLYQLLGLATLDISTLSQAKKEAMEAVLSGLECLTSRP